jgi:hypothetical protein
MALTIFGFRKGDFETWNEASISMADYNHKDITTAHLREARLDWQTRPGAEKLHRVMLQLQSSNPIKHPLALVAEIGECAAQENG